MRALVIATATSLACIAPALTRVQIDVPVLAGGEPGLDACASTGSVAGLNPRGDGFLSVRSGPGGRPFREIDRVYKGQHVYICDHQGPWFGVVYRKGGIGEDCGVSGSGWPRRVAYTGPCRHGWVHSRYIGDVAG
jgi:hypothetical protein